MLHIVQTLELLWVEIQFLHPPRAPGTLAKWQFLNVGRKLGVVQHGERRLLPENPKSADLWFWEFLGSLALRLALKALPKSMGSWDSLHLFCAASEPLLKVTPLNCQYHEGFRGYVNPETKSPENPNSQPEDTGQVFGKALEVDPKISMNPSISQRYQHAQQE